MQVYRSWNCVYADEECYGVCAVDGGSCYGIVVVLKYGWRRGNCEEDSETQNVMFRMCIGFFWVIFMNDDAFVVYYLS